MSRYRKRFSYLLAARHDRDRQKRAHDELMQRSPILGAILGLGGETVATARACGHVISAGGKQHRCLVSAGHEGDHRCGCGALWSDEQAEQTLN